MSDEPQKPILTENNEYALRLKAFFGECIKKEDPTEINEEVVE